MRRRTTATGRDRVCETLPPIADDLLGDRGPARRCCSKATSLTPGTVFKGGEVAVDATGKISCVGCDCATGGETVIACADATISPGLINTHDHITYTQDPPYTDTGERYEDRQQWRNGLDGHTKIPAPGGATRRPGVVGRAALPDGRRDLDRRLGRRRRACSATSTRRRCSRASTEQGRQLRHVPARRLGAARAAPATATTAHARPPPRRSRASSVRAAHVRGHRRDRAQRVPLRELDDLRHDDARRRRTTS